MESEPRTLTGRVRALMDALMLQRQTKESPGMLDEVLDSLGAAIERWRATSGFWGRLQRGGQDAVTAPGEWLEMSIPRELRTKLWARTIVYRLDGEVLAEHPVELPLHHRFDAAGVYELTAEARDAAGKPLAITPTASIVQVIDGAPVIVVGAEAVLGAEGIDHALRGLARVATLVYVDEHLEDRTAEIRRGIEALGLPKAAVIVHPEGSAEFRTLGVDFRSVLIEAMLRRARGAGVPVVGVFGAGPGLHRAAAHLGLAVLEPASDPSLWRTLHERFCAARQPLDEAGRRRWRLDEMTSARPLAGHRCRVELDNRRARERLFELVEGATTSIDLQFYLVRPSDFTDQLSARLVGAARRGVRVRMMVDALYSVDGLLGVNNEVIAGLRAEPGLEVIGLEPIRSREQVATQRLKQRDHRKVVVIDDRIALVTGRNCASEYYTGFEEVAVTDWTPHERVPWLDAHAEVEGPVVTAVARMFEDTWLRGGGRARAFAGKAAVVGDATVRLVVHDGVSDAEAMLSYEAIIDGAEHRLLVVNDFPIVDSLLAALRRALARGVEVVVLTGSAVARRGDGSFLKGPLYREAFEFLIKHRLSVLLRAGARAYEYATPPLPLVVCRGGQVRPYVHAKLVSADGRVASVGSANLDATASYWEREANLVIEDATTVADIERSIEALLVHSHRIDPESGYWRKEAPLRDLAAQLWPDAVYS